MFSDKRFGLSGSLVAAARGVLVEEKEDKDSVDAKKIKGGKTKVDLKPETDDNMKESKEATHPKTDKEKKLASLAHPKDKITHKDVLVGRGVLAKEEVDLESLTEEDLEEVLKKSDPAGKWIKDFVHSDDPKFAGKSKKKRMQMALAAYYAKQRNEEVDLSAEELERIEAIAQSLEEAKPTVVSAPIRGANQDQSGENTKSVSSDYTISDSKKMRKEEFELSESKTHHQSMALYHERMASAGDISDSQKAMHKKAAEQHKKASIKPKAHSALANNMTISLLSEEVELDEISKKGHWVYAMSAKTQVDKIRNKANKADWDHTHDNMSKDDVKTLEKRGKGLTYAAHKLTGIPVDDYKIFSKEEIELDEAKRGRPKKNPTPDDEQDEHEHVIMQLRKVVSTHGALPVKHLDGKSTKITPQLAQHALNKHAAMKTADDKQDFEQKLHKSHDSMKSALGQ